MKERVTRYSGGTMLNSLRPTKQRSKPSGSLENEQQMPFAKAPSKESGNAEEIIFVGPEEEERNEGGSGQPDELAFLQSFQARVVTRAPRPPMAATAPANTGPPEHSHLRNAVHPSRQHNVQVPSTNDDYYGRRDDRGHTFW